MDQAASSYQKFLGTSDNALQSQIWIPVSVYVLIAIVKKCPALDTPLYTLLQIRSVTLFEMPFEQTLHAQRPHFRTRQQQHPTESLSFLIGHYRAALTAYACSSLCVSPRLTPQFSHLMTIRPVGNHPS